MRHYCKYCYHVTGMLLADGEYYECQECFCHPLKKDYKRIEKEYYEMMKEIQRKELGMMKNGIKTNTN